MIDFTDYECPFCKRYFDETFTQIKKEYIQTNYPDSRLARAK